MACCEASAIALDPSWTGATTWLTATTVTWQPCVSVARTVLSSVPRIGPSSGIFWTSAITAFAIVAPLMVVVPTCTAPMGMGLACANACLNGSASGGPSNGTARTRSVIGCVTAAGLRETGVPGAPCTVVAQLPTTMGSAACATPPTEADARASSAVAATLNSLMRTPFLLSSNDRRSWW